MSSQVLEELRSFHEFIGQKLQHSDASLSPEDALDEWRFLHSEPDDYEAIKEALAAMDAGDTGRPFEEFAAEFRRKHHIPAMSGG